VARAKPATILARYRSNAKPLTPRFWDPPTAKPPVAVPVAKPDLVDRVLEELERTTTADKVHTMKVTLGWCSPAGQELSWRYWTKVCKSQSCRLQRKLAR
jgi:hypothetical protein